jgi:hypothetical protein
MKKILIIILLGLIQLNCLTIKSWFRAESILYTEKEKIILQTTLDSIGYNFGFDANLELDYIYSNKFDNKISILEKKIFNEKTFNYKKVNVIKFYEKIISLKKTSIDKMNLFYIEKEWIEYNTILKQYLPTLDIYIKILEDFMIQNYKDYAKKIILNRKKNETNK